MQKVCAGRFDTSKFISSNGKHGQNKNICKLGNSNSGQFKLVGGKRKAGKTEKTTEAKEDDEEEVRAEKRRRAQRRMSR